MMPIDRLLDELVGIGKMLKHLDGSDCLGWMPVIEYFKAWCVDIFAVWVVPTEVEPTIAHETGKQPSPASHIDEMSTHITGGPEQPRQFTGQLHIATNQAGIEHCDGA